MSKPPTANLPEPLDELTERDELGQVIQPFEVDFGAGDLGDAVPAFDQDLAETQEEFITQTLTWCAELFGATRARFIRPLESGVWLVYTRQKETVLTHMADFAEIAMAYTVGLGKQPLNVTRPRIARIDGSGLRPIALTSYLGIPIICQDRLIGVIEFAGDVRPDMESALASAAPRLANVGARLLFDPGLHRRRGTLTPESAFVIAGSIWSRGDVIVTPEELGFLAVVSGRMTVATAAAAANIPLDRATVLADELVERGLIALTE